MARTGKYIYGVINSNKELSFGPCGITGSEPAHQGEATGGEVYPVRNTTGANNESKISNGVYTVAYEDIACVVSNSPVQDYSSLLKETLGRFLVKHQTIIEKIMKDYTIIPMKFWTFVSDNNEVTQVLKRGYTQFKELFSTMDGKIELDVAATWNDLNSVIKEIGEEDKGIREFKAEVAKRPPEETLQDRIKIGMMIKDTLDKRGEKEQAHIIDYLKKLTIDFQKHQVMDDKMILNCAFLLEKVKEPDFDVKMKELDKEYKQKVNFKCVGPLPPYSFATCQLKKVGYSQINEARKLLGLRENTSLEEIKESYHQFAQKNHPDKQPDNTQINPVRNNLAEQDALPLAKISNGVKEKFEKMTQAYKLLTNCYQGSDITWEDNKQKDFIVVEIIRP